MAQWQNLGPHINEATTMNLVLQALRKAPGPLYMSQIMKLTGLPKDREKVIGKAVQRLYDKGWVDRQQNLGGRVTKGNIPKPGRWKKDYLYLLKKEYL